jgi:N-acetylglucosaminyl-diphospho-decaprenol L-rhamnosyltransferase
MHRRFAGLQRPPLSACVLALGIVTYNNKATQLERLVRSIELACRRLDQDHYVTRLYSIACGDQSEWAEIGIVHQCAAPDGNLGFGRGMNRLMAKAFADSQVSWFVCINPDGMLHRDLLAELLRCAEQYPDSIIEARQFPEEHPKPYDPYSGLTLWASGACMLIPRRVYEVIGGFDENIFMYMEDVDLSWRARSAGFTVRVAPRALFAHSVLDRNPGPLIERSYYLSHRYLAYKWRRPTEQAFYERVLLEQGYLTALPPLPLLDPAKTPTDTTPAVFEYGAAYAPLRWSP